MEKMEETEEKLPDSPLMAFARSRAESEMERMGGTRLMTFHIFLGILDAAAADPETVARGLGERDAVSAEQRETVSAEQRDAVSAEQRAVREILNSCGITEYGKLAREIRDAAADRDDEKESLMERFELFCRMSCRAHGKDRLEADAALRSILRVRPPLLRKCMPEALEICRKTEEEASRTKKFSQKAARLAELSSRVSELRRVLLDTVRGQNQAVMSFADGIASAQILAGERRRSPMGVFVFAGPPGVGKTFLAEKAAQILQWPFKRLDMSEYNVMYAVEELVGYDSTYANSKAGYLTSFVAENPYCILLFDEIEKAHIDVIHLFLQILDAGRLTDKFTKKTVPFRNTVIIFTTNAGRIFYENEDRRDADVSKNELLRALENEIDPFTKRPVFPRALCSRMAAGCPVLFRHLKTRDLVAVAKNEFARCAESFREEYNIPVSVDDGIPFYLLLRAGGDTDARTLRAEAENFFKSEIFAVSGYLGKDSPEEKLAALKGIRFAAEDAGAAVFGSDGEKRTVLVLGEPGFRDMCGDALDPDCALIAADGYAEAHAAVRDSRPVLVFLQMPEHPAPGETRKLLLFLESVPEEAPRLPVFVFCGKEDAEDQELKTALLGRGAAGVLGRDGGEEMRGTIRRLCEEQRLSEAADRFAREQTALTFDTEAVCVDGTFTITLRNFRVKRVVDGEDRGSMAGYGRMPDVTFDDVIGADEAKRELRSFIGFLKNPRSYRNSGLEAPKGVLLYGPPGTGKTYLAKALAHESGVPFFPANGSGFASMYVGSGPEAVRGLFAKARKYAPSIVFIDEIDTIGRLRTGSDGSAAYEETLNMLLTEMDGFGTDPLRPVFVVAASNYAVDGADGGRRVLDPALARRFDRRILVDLPDTTERREYLERTVKNYDGEISAGMISDIAKRSVGMSFPILKSILDQAARKALRDGKPLDDGYLDGAFENERFGNEKTWSQAALLRMARHEAGHGLAACLSGSAPSYMTIVPRGGHGGYVQQDTQGRDPFFTKRELEWRVRVCLAGRASEILFYGKEDGLSTAASKDLETATGILREMVCRYGMYEETGIAFCGADGPLPDAARQTVDRVLLEEAETTLRLLRENRSRLEALSDALLARNRLNAREIEEIVEKPE